MTFVWMMPSGLVVNTGTVGLLERVEMDCIDRNIKTNPPITGSIGILDLMVLSNTAQKLDDQYIYIYFKL